MSEQQSDDFFVPVFFLNLPPGEEEIPGCSAETAEDFLQHVEDWTEDYLLDDLAE